MAEDVVLKEMSEYSHPQDHKDSEDSKVLKDSKASETLTHAPTPPLVAFQDGVYNIETGRFYDCIHVSDSPDDFSSLTSIPRYNIIYTKIFQQLYVHSMWDAYLETLFVKPQKIAYIKSLIALTISGNAAKYGISLLFLSGTVNNAHQENHGKQTFMDILGNALRGFLYQVEQPEQSVGPAVRLVYINRPSAYRHCIYSRFIHTRPVLGLINCRDSYFKVKESQVYFLEFPKVFRLRTPVVGELPNRPESPTDTTITPTTADENSRIRHLRQNPNSLLRTILDQSFELYKQHHYSWESVAKSVKKFSKKNK